MRRFHSATASVLCPHLMDAPVPHPNISDILLNDWDEPTFAAQRGINDKWAIDQGFVRYVDLSKGHLNRVYAQLAVQFDKKDRQWVPFIFDTGAGSSFMSRATMERLGVPLVAGVGRQANFSCGHIFFTATMSSPDAKTASGDTLTNVNLIGMTELRKHVPLMWESFVAEIGSPSKLGFLWVQIVDLKGATKASKATAFQVTPAIANIDGFKKAVKAENPSLKDIDAYTFKVYAHDAATGGWVEVPEDALLVPNDKATAYHVVAGS